MKIKDAARLGMLIEAEGNLQVHRPCKRKGENCLSSPHISISICNVDLGILNWAKEILEKELNRSIALYRISNSSKIRTKQCYRITLGKKDDVHRILNICRGYMVGIKKRIADLIVSFLDYRKTIVKNNGYTHHKDYAKIFDNLVKKVDKIKQTYDLIEPVTTLHNPDQNGQKIKSELSSNIERSVEITDPPENGE